MRAFALVEIATGKTVQKRAVTHVKLLGETPKGHEWHPIDYNKIRTHNVEISGGKETLVETRFPAKRAAPPSFEERLRDLEARITALENGGRE